MNSKIARIVLQLVSPCALLACQNGSADHPVVDAALAQPSGPSDAASPSAAPGSTDGGTDAALDASSSSASTPDPTALRFAQGFVGKTLPVLLGALAQHTEVNDRFRALVGGEYGKFTSYSVGTPITRTGQVIVAEGCQPHACDDGRVIVALDLARGFIHAGVANGTKIRVFSEDSKHPPAPILAWKKDPVGWSNPLLH